MKKVAIILIIAVNLLTVISCKKEPVEPDKQLVEVTDGLYVLNEGLFNGNNASLTYYDYSTNQAANGYFETQNGRKLGDTGNDIAIYGSKIYIVVNNSNQLEVVDAYTGKSIKQIPFFDGDTPRQPRYVAFNKTNVFVCSFDGTVAVLDTATLEIKKFITVGKNPDGIAVANNKVYVANSGGLDYPNYANTVSVIDINTMEETKKITVNLNPGVIVADKYGDLYVVTRGNYNDVKASLQVIDSQTDELKKTFEDVQAVNLTINGDTAYAYYTDYVAGSSTVISINVKDETIISPNFVKDGTTIKAANGITIDEITGDVLVADAKDFTNTGEVFCFNKKGEKKYSFTAGLIPKGIVVFKKSVYKD